MRPVDPRLLRRARASAAYLGVLVVIGVGQALLILVQAGLLAHGIAAAYVDGAGLDDLRGTLVALAVVVAARAALAWLTESAAHSASAAVKSQLRQQLLAHIVQLGPRWLVGRRSGELATLATRGVDALDGYFARYLPQLVLAVLVPVAVLARIVTEDLVATITILVTLPLIPVFMVLIGMATQAHNRRRWRALQVLSHHFLDVVTGLPTLKVFGRAKAQAERVRRVTDDYRRETMRSLRLAFMSSAVLELMATISVALVAVGVGLRLVDGRLDLETALLVLILAPEAYLPLRQLGTHYHASAEGMAAAEEVFAVLDAPLPVRGTSSAVPDVRQGEVRVVDVRVEHEGRDLAAPDGVTLTLRPGRVVGLAGPSGSGKTTLLHVLLGLVVPSSGHVVVAGPLGVEVELGSLDPDGWRERVSWVAQDPYVVTGTLADNVRLGAPNASDEVVRDALRSAELELPLTSPIGERGSGLSVGQRRRMALARALVRDTPVLLLDEPTAGLDPETEAAVLATIRAAAANRLVLLVAHRPSVLAAADERVTLVAAEVVA